MSSFIQTPDIGEIAVRRKVLTPRQLDDCRALQRRIRDEFWLDYTLGQMILERVFATNARIRPILLQEGGAAEILGPDATVDFFKLSRAAESRLLERVRRDVIVHAAAFQECFQLQEDLSRLGILRRVGELLVDRGYVDRALADECRRAPVVAEELPALGFSRIAVHNGLVTEKEAADALELTDRIERDLGIRIPIGQVFFELGCLSRAEIEAILAAQVEVGRLAPDRTVLRVLKLSEIEEDILLQRLLGSGRLHEELLSRAVDLSTRLVEHGLDLGPLEVLWIQGVLGENDFRDVLSHQAAEIARLAIEAPPIRLSIASSAELLARQCPQDVSLPDWLFGQFALFAGALTRENLERDLLVHRLIRETGDGGRGSGFGGSIARRPSPVARQTPAAPSPFPTLGQILFDRYRNDPCRLRQLARAQRDLGKLLGRPYEIRTCHLSPLETSAVAARVACDPSLGPALERAARAARTLAELGIERRPEELLLETGDLEWEEIEEGARERVGRLSGGRRSETRPGDEALFERAFADSAASPNRTRLGEVAIDMGLLLPDLLARALTVQLLARGLGVNKRLGEILVELSYLEPEALAAVLRAQTARLDAVRRLPPPPPEEIDSLEPEGRFLLRRATETEALDAGRLHEILRIQRELRALGLAGSLPEILVRQGELDPEIVQGLRTEARREHESGPGRPAGVGRTNRPSAEKVRRAYRHAVCEAAASFDPSRPPPLGAARPDEAPASPTRRVAGAVLILAFVAGVAVFGIRELTRPAPNATGELESQQAGNEGTRTDAPDLSAAQVAALEVVTPASGGAARPGNPATSDEPAAPHRAPLSAGPAPRQGELVEKPAPSTGVHLAEPPGFPGREGKDAVTAERLAEPLADLRASLVSDGLATRIGVRFRSGFPPGTTLVLTLSAAEEPAAVLHRTTVRLTSRGAFEIEVAPCPRSLPPSNYLVGLSYRPELQPGIVAFEHAQEVSIRVVTRLGTDDEIRAARAATASALGPLVGRLEGALRMLQEDPGSLDARSAAREAQAVAEIRDALTDASEPISLPAHAKSLADVARILGEILSGSVRGEPLDQSELARAGNELRACREAIER
ncbi:MAG: hypothetical protein HY720_16185 [Planctomycetes bacterium]|nr:hypothetical protein [Planctomycetota bacterium]